MLDNATTQNRPCKRCRQSLPEDSHVHQKYCPPCKLDVKREHGRETARRKAAADKAAFANLKLECPRCGTTFQRVTAYNKTYVDHCEPCRKVLRAADSNEVKKARNRARRAERYAREGRWSTCEQCQANLHCAPIGPLRRFCGPCWESRATAARAQWQADNPQVAQRRRARIYSPGYQYFPREEIFERDGWRCGICSKRIRRSLKWPHPMSATIDHIIPLSLGGQHNRLNVRAAHARCNQLRGNRGGGEQLLLVG